MDASKVVEEVSTHSRLKAAGSEKWAWYLALAEFQHTAA